MQARERKTGILPPKKKKEDQRRGEALATGLPRPEQARAGSGELPLFPAFKVISIPCVGCWSGATAEDAGGERPVPSGAVRREAGGQGGRDRRDGAGVSPGPAPRGCGRCPRCPSGPTCPRLRAPRVAARASPKASAPGSLQCPGRWGILGAALSAPRYEEPRATRSPGSPFPPGPGGARTGRGGSAAAQHPAPLGQPPRPVPASPPPHSQGRRLPGRAAAGPPGPARPLSEVR